MKFSTLALVLGLAFSGSAFAVTDTWDSGKPWGSATPVVEAEWNLFGFTSPLIREDNTPDVYLTPGATATLKETSGTGFVSSTSNVYSFSGNGTAFTTTLTGTAGGLYDVYLRVAAFGTLPSQVASLNGATASAIVQLNAPTDSSMGTVDEVEYYWKWSVTGSSLYTFNFQGLGPHMSLDQVALAVVAVPEPETYGLMGLGLGLVALATRRSRRTKV